MIEKTQLQEQTQKIRSQSCFKRKTFNKRLSFIDKLSLSNTRENNKQINKLFSLGNKGINFSRSHCSNQYYQGKDQQVLKQRETEMLEMLRITAS